MDLNRQVHDFNRRVQQVRLQPPLAADRERYIAQQAAQAEMHALELAQQRERFIAAQAEQERLRVQGILPPPGGFNQSPLPPSNFNFSKPSVKQLDIDKKTDELKKDTLYLNKYLKYKNKYLQLKNTVF